MQNTINVLQTALELERRGREFYFDSADKVRDPVIKSALMSLAHDEDEHAAMISRFCEAMEHGRDLSDSQASQVPHDALARIQAVIDQTGSKISADAGFREVYETASALERRSVDFYREQAESASDPGAKKFYGFLVTLETIHMDVLQSLLESIIAIEEETH
jgi:rubrerythrin